MTNVALLRGAGGASRIVRRCRRGVCALPNAGRRDSTGSSPGIKTANQDARHVRCRTDGAARAGHCAGGAIGSLGGAGRDDGLPRPSVSAGCPFLVRPAGFVTEPGAVARPSGCGPPQRSIFLARKRCSAMPVKHKRSPCAAGSPSSKQATLAHPRLVHGFLVRLPAPSTIPVQSAKRASGKVARASAGARDPTAAKHEGPPDDATFH